MSTAQCCANVIRFLSMDAVQKANSGHPGMPMGMADIAEVLWRRYLNHNPQNPQWWNRDRFVLSNGHGSMLLYSLLHLTGYDLSIDELKNFRQMGSKTPGHPEYGMTPGVETTTGPLGQGIANAVGMALAEKTLAAQFNRDGAEVINHFTYAFVGDGCLMEGISHEVCSLAGTLGLGKLIVFWDDNGISIDGEVGAWFSDNTPERFKAYGWQVIEAIDGHDADAIAAAIDAAQTDLSRPTLIDCRTTIGYGAPKKAGTAGAHGAPLGDEEIAAVRQALGWEHGPFEVPQACYNAWNAVEAGQEKEQQWQTLWSDYQEKHPELARELERRLEGELPDDWEFQCVDWLAESQQAGADVASRKASQMAIERLGAMLPELFGGSADLAGSNLTLWSGSHSVDAKAEGNYCYYGVREFGMAAMMNGMALYGGFIPYGGTFLVFSDYARNAIRMAALMRQRCVYVLTHDSIGLGEDGPTHQPVEHVNSLRLIPNLDVWRPCDAVETAVAWQVSLESAEGPSALILSRQTLPHQSRHPEQVNAIQKGGYVLMASESPQLTLIATGSEVALACSAAEKLTQMGYAIQVVSMPCAERFLAQSGEYQETVIPSDAPVLAIEAGSTDFWYRFVGHCGAVIGMDCFGESAPAGELFKHFGFSVDNVVSKGMQLVAEQAELAE